MNSILLALEEGGPAARTAAEPSAKADIPLPRAVSLGPTTLGQSPAAVGIAAQLLHVSSDCPAGNIRRLLVGFAGLFAFGTVSRWAFAREYSSWERAAAAFPQNLHTLTLPLVAALTLALCLPGLLILLSLYGEQLGLRAVMHIVCRQYARLGLLALAATPVVLLYSVTGAESGFIAALSACYYLCAGAWSMGGLTLSLDQALSRKRWLSRLTLLLWFGFTGVIAVHLLLKLTVGID
jgi:hypothetical protein